MTNDIQKLFLPEGYAATIALRGAEVPDDSAYAIHVTVTTGSDRSRQTWISRDVLKTTDTSLQKIIDDAVFKLKSARDSQSRYQGNGDA